MRRGVYTAGMSGSTPRAALITGASSGIGRATALELARAGLTVLVNARRGDELDKLVNEVEAAQGVAHALPGDASEPGVLDRLWAEACEAADGVPDVLVANAGRGLQGGVLSSDPAVWESMFRLNVTGTMHLMRNAAEAMRDAPDDGGGSGGGRGGGAAARDIVVIGSVVGTNVSPFSAVYGATKFAIEAAAEALRREMAQASGGAGLGVRVTVVKPGVVESEFQDVAGYDRENFGKAVEKFGPMLDPADIARVIRFVVEQPPNVHVNQVTVRPVGQDYP